MSKRTASAANRFVTAYGSAEKSSVGMVSACVDILTDGTKGSALVAAVRGAYEHKIGAFNSPTESKRFEALVSQRAFAASLVLIVGDDAASDPVAIKAALSVASGALPRKQATDIAAAHKGSNDAPAFAAGIKLALNDKKVTSRAPRNAGGKGKGKGTETPTQTLVVPPVDSFKTGIRAVDAALRSETDPKKRAAMLTALRALILRESKAPVTAPVETVAA